MFLKLDCFLLKYLRFKAYETYITVIQYRIKVA